VDEFRLSVATDMDRSDGQLLRLEGDVGLVPGDYRSDAPTRHLHRESPRGRGDHEAQAAGAAQHRHRPQSASTREVPVLATEAEGRLAAIVDFTFNLGAGRLQTSTLRRRVNQRDWENAANELRRWVHGGGKVLPGLVTRREAEVGYFLGG
jgi:lysozyme